MREISGSDEVRWRVFGEEKVKFTFKMAEMESVRWCRVTVRETISDELGLVGRRIHTGESEIVYVSQQKRNGIKRRPVELKVVSVEEGDFVYRFT